jgi:UDP-glucose:(heptosyl)LPS alpha-1,3-glucosyltransferase
MLPGKEEGTPKNSVQSCLRIALCHKRLDERGGTERDLYLTAKGLSDLGHEIHLFCSEFAIDPPAGTFAHIVPVVSFGRTAELWSFAVRAPRIVQQFDCDVVIGFGRMMSQDVLRSGGGCHKLFLEKSGKQGGLRRRIWQNLSFYHQSVLAIEKRQFRLGGFKKAIAVSQQVKREFSTAYAVPDYKILVLYNGVDQKRFHPALRARWRNAIRTELKIPLAATVVLFVGNGFRRKGLDGLLKIWRSSCLQNVFLLVVGDDARRRAYKRWAARQAPGRVIFVGRQDQVEKFYGAADLVALPSVQEAFGNVILEALASGLPVVVSRTVGAGELLTGSLAEGIIDQPEQPAELEARLLHVIDKCRNPSTAVEARHLGEAYSWSNYFRKLEACLMEVCRQNRSASLS